jgi:hypothetical protein
MKQVETFQWKLPPKPWAGPRAKPYISSWKMTREEAAKHGAIEPVLESRDVQLVAETPEEAAEVRQQSDTSVWSGKPRP